jgi:hypothetical protein
MGSCTSTSLKICKSIECEALAEDEDYCSYCQFIKFKSSQENKISPKATKATQTIITQLIQPNTYIHNSPLPHHRTMTPATNSRPIRQNSLNQTTFAEELQELVTSGNKLYSQINFKNGAPDSCYQNIQRKHIFAEKLAQINKCGVKCSIVSPLEGDTIN